MSDAWIQAIIISSLAGYAAAGVFVWCAAFTVDDEWIDSGGFFICVFWWPIFLVGCLGVKVGKWINSRRGGGAKE